MKKGLLISMVLLLPLALLAVPRTGVVYEVGTGTWCQFCPGAANAVDNLHAKYGNQVVVIENHNGDVFTGEGDLRNQWYGVSGYPTTIIDGIIRLSGAGMALMQYEPKFLERIDTESPISIELTKTYEAGYHGTGVMTATINNESGGDITGKIHFVITESNIPYVWQGQEWLHFVARDWIPTQVGNDITIPDGETVVVDQDYVIDWGNWTVPTNDLHNIQLSCFVQAANKEIYNAVVIDMIGAPNGEATGSEILNDDGMLHPGETVDFVITLLNGNSYPWENLVGTLSTSDTEVEIVDEEGTWAAVEPGAEGTNAADPFQLKLKAGNEDGYRPNLSLDIGGHDPIEFQVFEPVGVFEETGLAFSLSLPGLISDNFVASISVPLAAHADMILVDASGRKVTSIYSGNLSSGVNLVAVDVADLTSGTYFVKTTVSGQSTVDRLVLLK